MAASTLDVVNALEKLSVDETRALVFHLKVPGNVLDNIDVQYAGATRSIKYVEEWLKYDEDASWENLVSGLKQIGRNAVAKVVESAYLPTLAHDPTQSPAMDMERVAKEIEKFKDEFSNLKINTQEFLSDKESQDPKFLARFREYLLDIPVSKKTVHARFFYKHEDEIFRAGNIERIFAILRHYCNYSNYDIILHLVKKFCDAPLKRRMQKYHDSFDRFEKDTTVDIYLCTISARQQSEVYQASSRMVMIIDKPASECTLHEIRRLKESLAESADIHSYCAYIEYVAISSVLLVLRIPQSCVVWVGMAVTPDFIQDHHLRGVSIDGEDITYYQDKKYLVC